MAQILWVEDQSHWINKLGPLLEQAELGDGEPPNTLHVFRFAEAACQHIRLSQQAPDIALLDAHMNGNDSAGFMVSRALIKKWPELPILYLSEHSGTDVEERALELSETRDFIAKHQQNIESVLCWRIKAALRQAQLQKNTGGTAEPGELLRSGAVVMDLRTWEVYWHQQRLMNPKNTERPLPPAPRKILRRLLECSPRPLSTSQLAEQLDLDEFTYASYRQHVKTLRHSFEHVARKLGKNSFLERCKAGEGIVTFGDERAYCWKPLREDTR